MDCYEKHIRKLSFDGVFFKNLSFGRATFTTSFYEPAICLPQVRGAASCLEEIGGKLAPRKIQA